MGSLQLRYSALRAPTTGGVAKHLFTTFITTNSNEPVTIAAKQTQNITTENDFNNLTYSDFCRKTCSGRFYRS
ncbi:hypothetical protein KIN20_037491 [Parelaphostrongylus tenuis]|uniref:Uncharacterized protein n=1 Tax=Parelaphostrongylus tenuis TaxID=148309 RepID=A0AAD5WL73_PARTN|nr:hypothetical protein KIN20_037491 [Parelaphostrongylus tenuis]